LLVLDKPYFIYGEPTDLLFDKHIESWNSSAKIAWETDEGDGYQLVRATFFFSWLNDSSNAVAITGVTSSLTAAGRCLLRVNPGFLYWAFAFALLSAHLTVFLGQTQIDSEFISIGSFGAEADANIFGGAAHTDTHDVFRTVDVSCFQPILVPGRQRVIFAVEMMVEVGRGAGKIVLRFDREPFVTCPSLTVAFFEPLLAFRETLIADSAGWQGYCLVQRIEPARLARSGTQVKLTLRASSVSSASINAIYISQADPAGQAFDSTDDLTAVTSAPIVIPAGSEVTLPAVNYRFDESKPLLIAVDFSPAPASAIRRNGAVLPGQASAYYKLGAAAATPNRANFTAASVGVLLIETIEVF
jgi:hypothetical protein